VLAQGNVGAGTGALVRGIRGDDLARSRRWSPTTSEAGLAGRLRPERGRRHRPAHGENLGLVLGDTITLISPDGDVTPLGTTPRVKGYPVVAIFEIGMSEYDSSIIFMPFAEAQLYFNIEGTPRRRSRSSSTIPTTSMRCGRSRRPRSGRSSCPTGASATRPSSPRCRSSATSCS
jgi:hypothetical protein